MEALKEGFEKLPDSEKIKFVEALSKEYTSGICNETGSLEKHFLNVLLHSLRSGQKRIAENNNEVGVSKKKQKTLDSWLIKRNCDSHKPDGSPSRTVVQENVISVTNDVPENSYSVRIAANNLEAAIPTNSSNNVSNENESSASKIAIRNKSEKSKKNAVNNVIKASDIETTELVTEKYNLRSKKKFSKLIPIAEYDNMKYLKNGNNNLLSTNESNECLKDHNKFNREINETLKSSKELTAKNLQTIQYQTDSNIVQHIEEDECHSTNISNSLLDNKTYNLRTKKKNAKLQNSVQSSVDSPTDDVMYEELSDHLGTTSQKKILKTTSSEQSNYEAFCKLNTECSRAGLNVMDILGHEKIQNLLSDDEKLRNEAVVFIGSFKSSSGKILPVVHLLESKNKLLESINKLQKLH